MFKTDTGGVNPHFFHTLAPLFSVLKLLLCLLSMLVSVALPVTFAMLVKADGFDTLSILAIMGGFLFSAVCFVLSCRAFYDACKKLCHSGRLS